MIHTTTDLYFAAAVISGGHKLTSTTRAGGRMTWVFGNVDLAGIEVDYINNRLMVPARTFADTVRRLKAGAVAASKADA